MSIRTRLTLWYTTLLAALLLLFGIALYTYISITLYNNSDKEMASFAKLVERNVTVNISPIFGDFVVKLHQLNDFQYSNYLIQIVRPEDGEVVYNNLIKGIELPHSQNAIKSTLSKNVFVQNEVVEGINVRVYNKIFTKEIGGTTQQIGILQIGLRIDDTIMLLQSVAIFLIYFALFVIAAAATTGWYLARKALKPIEQIIMAAELVQNGNDLGRRIVHDGPPDEIGKLTSTINSMLSRIEGTYRDLEESNILQRRFVSDASHELRTPLTTIRGNVELLEKVWRQQPEESTMTDEEKRTLFLEALGDIAGEASRMSRLVNDMLALARADAGVSMPKESVHIKEIVEDVSRKASLLPKQVDFRIGNLSVLEGVHVYANGDYLRQLLFIFIENAFKYTREGYVLLEGVHLEGQVGIQISDTGMGMDKDEVPHIFERFYRADESRGVTAGTGLGLSIARWIIDQHDGSIEVTTKLGEGSTFMIWLPTFEGGSESTTLTDSGAADGYDE